MKVILLDAYNMIHRCRFNFGGGKTDLEGWSLFYNFNRLVRATIEEYNPDKVYFVLDGKPVQRLEKFAEYKGNRKKNLDDPEELKYWENFRRQRKEVVSFVKESLPLYVVSHEGQEADDLIYYLAKYKCSSDDDVIIVSSDTDYIQVINELPNVSLYNPVAKKWRNKTEYDYVSWKAMVGDKSDNIPGVPRVGKVTAEKILKTGTLNERLQDKKFRDNYELSYSLIKMIDLKSIEDEICISKAEFDESSIKEKFIEREFNSLLTDDYYTKYIQLVSGLS
jgi:DNA polymerase I